MLSFHRQFVFGMRVERLFLETVFFALRFRIETFAQRVQFGIKRPDVVASVARRPEMRRSEPDQQNRPNQRHRVAQRIRVNIQANFHLGGVENDYCKARPQSAEYDRQRYYDGISVDRAESDPRLRLICFSLFWFHRPSLGFAVLQMYSICNIV